MKLKVFVRAILGTKRLFHSDNLTKIKRKFSLNFLQFFLHPGLKNQAMTDR